jgi:hypothetical protein
MQLDPHGAADSRELTPPSKSMPTTPTLDILWRSKPHSKIGKLYKMLVAKTAPQRGNAAAE